MIVHARVENCQLIHTGRVLSQRPRSILVGATLVTTIRHLACDPGDACDADRRSAMSRAISKLQQNQRLARDPCRSAVNQESGGSIPPAPANGIGELRGSTAPPNCRWCPCRCPLAASADAHLAAPDRATRDQPLRSGHGLADVRRPHRSLRRPRDVGRGTRRAPRPRGDERLRRARSAARASPARMHSPARPAARPGACPLPPPASAAGAGGRSSSRSTAGSAPAHRRCPGDVGREVGLPGAGGGDAVDIGLIQGIRRLAPEELVHQVCRVG